jgi:ABC-2 type transport system ATP-binding protein
MTAPNAVQVERLIKKYSLGRMYGLLGSRLSRRVEEVLDLTDPTDRRHDRAGQYSGGMPRRLNIGIAPLHEPKIVILDEPTVGIDP